MRISYIINIYLLYNPMKSKCVIFLPKRYKLTVPTVSLACLDGNTLDYEDQIKYLGVVLSSDCKDDNDISRQVRCLYASANTILRKFASCSMPVNIQLQEKYCCNFYCAALWYDYPKRALQKLKVAYNNIFRKCLGFNFRDNASHMFVNNRLYTFDARIRKSCFSFRGRLLASTNVIIHALYNNFWITNN